MDHLSIEIFFLYWTLKVHAVVGASLGGMSSLNAAALYPDRVGR